MLMQARYSETGLSLFVIISFFFHGLVFTALVLPDFYRLADFEKSMKKSLSGAGKGRDIIVNINQDNIREINPATLLSDRDSSAKGYITREKGNRWLNNSLDFTIIKGTPGKGTGGSGATDSTSRMQQDFMLSKMSEVVIGLRMLKKPVTVSTGDGKGVQILIPDKDDITTKNAIYYSNSGMFSFNTAKFKNFEYFKSMKDRIASNWYPPLMANAVFGGYNPATGGYAPGRMRIMAIPSQQVKIFFTMNRKGDIIDVYVVDSMGNETLDTSCVESIRMSRSFGKVPDDITGDVVGIPFIFGYYVY